MSSHLPPSLVSVPERALTSNTFADKPFDALVVVAPAPLRSHGVLEGVIGTILGAALRADRTLDRGPRPPSVIHAPGLPGERLIVAPMGPLTDDTEDVRFVAEAVAAATNRAVDAGAKKPLVWVIVPRAARFAHAYEVAALAAMGSQWKPLEAREAGKASAGAETIGIVGLDETRIETLVAIERGRMLCRDITGTEPERMAPRRIAELCAQTFAAVGVNVEVEHDVSGYPLLAAVARASMSVERHRPCVVKLSYEPEVPAKYTVILAGKGVTYDMGGADLKTDGHMAGMSRDKGGAGSAAGFVLAAALAKLPVRVICLLGLVRNSIGENAFVSDEVIVARSGVRVRIGNTDAEGRLVLADLLAEAKTLVDDSTPTMLMSIATLTGHVYRAFGPYAGVIGNGPAKRAGVMEQMDELGEAWGEPIERSRPRREDYAFVAPRSASEDVLSSNRLASVNTPRGHQFPFAFIDIASGLKGGPVPFVHVDIAGVALDPPDWQFGRPTGNPILTLMALCDQLGKPTELK